MLPTPGVRVLPFSARLPRSALAGQRARLARQALAECHLCELHCAVNRLDGERGACRAGAQTRVFSAQVEVADELELVPTFAVAFSGCNLRCDFCITGVESWDARAGEVFLLEELVARAKAALAHDARTIMFLGGEPIIHLPALLEIVAALPDRARLVLKTNACASAQARAWLDGVFDVWLADYKFGNDACALRLAQAPDYTRVVRENLLWASRHSELIVRHVLMPGHVDCCWAPVARWLAEHWPGGKVSLRTGFWPAWRAHRHPELRDTVGEVEAKRALDIARDLDLNLIA